MNWFIWALLSAFFARATAVLAKIGVKEINSNLATAIRTVVILVFAWAVAMFTHTQPLSAISRRTWIFLILSGLATGLSWLCYFRALQLGEASRVAPVDKLSVVVAMALAAIFLHEPLTWHHWVGGLFIFSGGWWWRMHSAGRQVCRSPDTSQRRSILRRRFRLTVTLPL